MRLHVLLLSIAVVVSSATSQPPTTSPEGAKPLATSSQDDELRREIAQMRVLMGQMQRNLAQVTSGETALKHQFELDIQMWRILVNRMEKQLLAEPPAKR
jgi:hypothetical protein